MIRARFFVVFLTSLTLAACTTGPSRDVTGSNTSQLRLCSGTSISNAPQADRRGTITGYQPQANIGGVWLYRAPVDGCLSSGYGPRRGGAGRFHEGVDLYTGQPRAIIAGGDGVVEFVGNQRGYGRTVVIKHNNRVQTRYAHLSSYARGLSRGDRVNGGMVIGKTGDSGNATAIHLHYEILLRDRPVDPLTAGK